MPSARTTITELSTALGMAGEDELEPLLARRPPQVVNLTNADWEALAAWWRMDNYRADFAAGFANGQAFLHAADALNGRRPKIIEWTGGRRPPGDEVVPSDLRVDHVYLVSCKYLSKILHNPSPSRLIEGLLTSAAVEDRTNWYQRVAPQEFQDLYELCAPVVEGPRLPSHAVALIASERRRLALALRGGWPVGAADAYGRLSNVVAEATARSWRSRVNAGNRQAVLWRLLRIGSAPYFILGSSEAGPMRLRIATPWDWHQTYRLRRFVIEAQPGGQPRVGWSALYEDRAAGETKAVSGHVEIRWSHGRFGQPPEAKVYLDTPHERVPGYHQL